MQIFYAYNTADNKAFLDKEETRHCTKTLRKVVGDTIAIIDGKGGFWEAQIISFDKKSCELAILKEIKQAPARDYYIHIAIAPTKNISRLEWFLEKTTEFGIDEITPILCQRSERKIIKKERLQKIILSATKQSIKSKLPKFNELKKFKDLILENQELTYKTIAHCNKKNLPALKKSIINQKKILILIGPEGDFSEQEVSLALENGFVEIGLGSSRLRTETAGIAACHTVHIIHGV